MRGRATIIINPSMARAGGLSAPKAGLFSTVGRLVLTGWGDLSEHLTEPPFQVKYVRPMRGYATAQRLVLICPQRVGGAPGTKDRDSSHPLDGSLVLIGCGNVSKHLIEPPFQEKSVQPTRGRATVIVNRTHAKVRYIGPTFITTYVGPFYRTPMPQWLWWSDGDE